MNETVLKKTHGRNYSETVSTVRMRILSAHIYTGEALRRLDDLRKEGRNERGDAQAKEGSREKRKDREFPCALLDHLVIRDLVIARGGDHILLSEMNDFKNESFIRIPIHRYAPFKND